MELKRKYDLAINEGQQSIDAMVVSTIDEAGNKPNSRYVNAKYIIGNEIIFFSNYKSAKAKEIESNNSVSCIFYWNLINTQIRLKGAVNKTPSLFSDEHFKKRDNKKNAIAVSSRQSEKIESFEKVKEQYKNVLNVNSILSRPDYWGGYSINVDYVEFWEGSDYRLNNRRVFSLKDNLWEFYFLQP